MELIIKQLTTVVRELEEHEFQNVFDVLVEDQSAEIDGVIGSMICLVETARDFYKKHFPRMKRLRDERASQRPHLTFK